MRVLELFSGTGTLSAVARARGHEAFTVDLFEPADLQADVLTLTPEAVYAATGWDHIDMLWASPICTGFSIAAVSKSWHHPEPGVYIPKSETAELSLALLERTFHLIERLRPTAWFVENPRGMARKMQVVQGHRRETVTLCQYGDTRQKPTDVWTNNLAWKPRPMCKRGAPCHEAAPRGARTGTQGIKGALNRAKLPEELCHEVIEAAEAEVRWLDGRVAAALAAEGLEDAA